jgi:hypothetical protein
MKINMWLFLLLMVFFTFLTGYTAMALFAKENPDASFAMRFASFAGVASPAEINAVSDCGCFGDFIKLRPWESFLKDLILMVPTLFLFWKRKSLLSGFPERFNQGAMVFSLLFCSWVAWDAIAHLPRFDFRPYKVGADIRAAMQPSEPLRYVYTMERNGQTQDFTEYPTDTTWKFKSMDIANPEAKPKVTDYSVWNDEGDITQETFTGNKLMVIIRKAEKVEPGSLERTVQLTKEISQHKELPLQALILTGSTSQAIDQLRHDNQLALPYYYADGTVLKTILRSNAGIWLLKDGVVKGKWHIRDTPDWKEVSEALAK